jgi:hypothetical protein
MVLGGALGPERLSTVRVQEPGFVLVLMSLSWLPGFPWASLLPTSDQIIQMHLSPASHVQPLPCFFPQTEKSLGQGGSSCTAWALRAYCARRRWDTHPSNTVGGNRIISSESISEK